MGWSTTAMAARYLSGIWTSTLTGSDLGYAVENTVESRDRMPELEPAEQAPSHPTSACRGIDRPDVAQCEMVRPASRTCLLYQQETDSGEDLGEQAPKPGGSAKPVFEQMLVSRAELSYPRSQQERVDRYVVSCITTVMIAVCMSERNQLKDQPAPRTMRLAGGVIRCSRASRLTVRSNDRESLVGSSAFRLP
jgi:hypothetical protein